MKKMLIALATVALTGGSFVNSSLWINKVTQQGGFNAKITPKSNFQKTNEDAEDIANKIWNQTVKIDPNFWFNKDIKNDQTDFNKQLVQQGIITQDEKQYVKWGSLNINKAGWFANQGAFTVTKDGATATGHVTVDATEGETSTQIAGKIAKANLRFNYNYWDQKTVGSYLSQVQTILANEKILTKAEAADVIGLQSPVTITKTGKIPISFNVNDNKSQAYANANLNVVEDGLSSDEIAQQLHTDGEYDSGGKWVQNDTYFLKGTATNQYADSAVVVQNFHNILQYDKGPDFWSQSDIQDITLPHTIVTDNPNGNNMNATVTKDGQTSTVAVQLVAYTSSFLNLEDQDDYDMSFDVQLSPTSVMFLADYFDTHSSVKECLGYFYQYLNDNDFNILPSVDKWCVPYWDRLEGWMGDYGSAGDYKSDVAYDECGSYGQAFAKALVNKVINSYTTDWLSVEVTWYYDKDNGSYQTPYYAFW